MEWVLILFTFWGTEVNGGKFSSLNECARFGASITRKTEGRYYSHYYCRKAP